MKLKKFLCLALIAGMVTSSIPIGGMKKVSAIETLKGALFLDSDFSGFNTEYYVSVLRRFDTDNDGILSVDEQLAVEEIRLINGTSSEEVQTTPSVGALPHIDAFKNLKNLYIHDFNAFDVDLTSNTKLENLSITKSMGVPSIKVAGLKSLKVVAVGLSFTSDIYNSFTSFDFSGCSSLDTVFIAYDENLEKVNFSGCKSLDSATITGSKVIKSIDFSDCTKLRYTYLNKNEGLRKIYVPSTYTEANLARKSERGLTNSSFLVSGFNYNLPCTVYFGKPGQEAKSKKFTGDPTEIKLDKNGKVSYIGTTFTSKNLCYEIITSSQVKIYALTTRSKIKNLKIPDKVSYNGKKYKVTVVGENAFNYCLKLKKVTFGKNIKRIDAQGFRNCSKLKKLIFKGKALKKVKKYAFANIPNTLKVKAPKKVKKKYKKLIKKAGAKKVK